MLERQKVAEEVKGLEQPARATLRKHGVRFGAYHIYLPALLKPAPRVLATQLWALKHGGPETRGLAAVEQLAASGRTSIAADQHIPKVLYRAAGYRVCGERAVRVDILERLADLIRPALAWREGAAGVEAAGRGRRLRLHRQRGNDVAGRLLGGEFCGDPALARLPHGEAAEADRSRHGRRRAGGSGRRPSGVRSCERDAGTSGAAVGRRGSRSGGDRARAGAGARGAGRAGERIAACRGRCPLTRRPPCPARPPSQARRSPTTAKTRIRASGGRRRPARRPQLKPSNSSRSGGPVGREHHRAGPRKERRAPRERRPQRPAPAPPDGRGSRRGSACRHRRRPTPRPATARARGWRARRPPRPRRERGTAIAPSAPIAPPARCAPSAASGARPDRPARAERPPRGDPRADRAPRADRPDRDPDLRAKYIKGKGEGRREQDARSEFAVRQARGAQGAARIERQGAALSARAIWIASA